MCIPSPASPAGGRRWSVPAGRIDTERYFIICSNVIGGCMGSTGPASINPATGKPWGLDFPVITIPDMVRAQAMLIDRLGIDTLFCGGRRLDGRHAGAAMGRGLSRARVLRAADRLRDAALGAEHRVPRGRPSGRDGRSRLARRPLSSIEGIHPHRGLAVARMAAHITYLSDAALHRKFGRRMQDRELPTFSFDADFQVESYLRYQGSSFVERFDANSYLYLTRAMDYFDIAADHGGVLAKAFADTRPASAWSRSPATGCFRPRNRARIVHALNAVGARVSFAEIETDRGHDAFLLDVPEFFDIARAFLQSAGKARGLTGSELA